MKDIEGVRERIADNCWKIGELKKGRNSLEDKEDV